MLLLGSIIPMLFVIALIFLIVACAGKSNDAQANSFPRTIKTLYLYIVTIGSLIMMIIGSIVAINSTTNLLIPEHPPETLTISHQQSIDNQHSREIAGLFSSLTALALGTSLFIYHGKRIKKS